MRKLLTICAVLGLFACEKDDSLLKSNPIDSKINIEVREVLRSDSRSLTLNCFTEKIYPSGGFGINTTKKTSSTGSAITFESIFTPDYGYALSSPAGTVVDLAVVPNGVYDIELNNANLKNKGKLKVTDTNISLVFTSKKGIEFVRTVTNRVPAKTYWGMIGYHQQSSLELVNDFLRKFEEIGGVFKPQTPGHYVYYEINDSGEMIIDEKNSGYYYVKPFIFQFEGNEADLKNLIKTEGKVLKDQLVINMETYKGEQVYNWGN